MIAKNRSPETRSAEGMHCLHPLLSSSAEATLHRCALESSPENRVHPTGEVVVASAGPAEKEEKKIIAHVEKGT